MSIRHCSILAFRHVDKSGWSYVGVWRHMKTPVDCNAHRMKSMFTAIGIVIAKIIIFVVWLNLEVKLNKNSLFSFEKVSSVSNLLVREGTFTFSTVIAPSYRTRHYSYFSDICFQKIYEHRARTSCADSCYSRLPFSRHTNTRMLLGFWVWRDGLHRLPYTPLHPFSASSWMWKCFLGSIRELCETNC